MLNSFAFSNSSFPSGSSHKATVFKTLFDSSKLPHIPITHKLCYTSSKNTVIYKPHTDVGLIGRSSAGYLAQRKRL
jgi:hypothetical protein